MAEDKKKGGLLRSSGLVSGLTMVSRVFGLIRDMVIAYFFGASAGADAFFVALRIPNLFRRLFAEGAFAQAFVPVLSEYRNRESKDAVRALVSRASGTLGLYLLILTVLGVLGAEYVIRVFAYGYVYHAHIEKLALAVEMLRVTFPYLLLISMTAFAGAVLNTFGRFAVPAFTPVLLNLSLILCAVFLRPYMDQPVMALAWGVLIAGVAQLTFQLPFLAKEKLLVAPRFDTRDPGVRKILTLMLPALFGVSVGQINLLLDAVLASFLETGTLSWLWYSDRLLELPLAIFAIAIATVILPGLSKDHASSSPEEFSRTLNWAIRLVLLLGLPATIALVFLSDALIATLFFHGEMTERDVSMSGMALAAYGVGLLGHMLVKVLAPGYFARQDTSTPVRYGVVALVSNMVLNLVLIWHLKHAGLALATSISAFINAGLLFYGLKKSGVLVLEKGWSRFFGQALLANLVMLITLFLIRPAMNTWFAFGLVERIVIMLLICLAGALIYAVCLRVTGVKVGQFIR
ncbi:MAG TPA: murein biosynthesis integral membrane protein MurJ [Gammaproteobacteria bacterium]|nr:murein biosynthesis integral membrane protein MurJ [Gammaproteobacteria bacterium]